MAVLVGLCTVLSIGMSKLGIAKESIMMILLVGVLLTTTVTTGYVYGVVASVMSVLVFNYYFTVPVHTLETYNSSDMILMLSFLIVSLISGSLTSRFQKQTKLAKQNEQTAYLLYEVTKSFLNITGQKNIILQGIAYIYTHTQYKSQVTLYETGEIYRYEADASQVNAAEEHVGSQCIGLEIPIEGLNRQLGKLEVFAEGENFTLEQELLMKTVANQMGISLDREFIYNERENIRIAMEREHLRSNLLRAISHDLRTPLTGIVGGSGVIIENIDHLDKASIKKLVKGINEEALWLNNLVENILNMTRIGEGKLVLERYGEVVDDVIYEALSHVSNLVNERDLEVIMPEDVVVLPMDGKLIVQVIINLLTNAIKHTEENGHIILKVYTKGKYAIFEVADNGKGIDESIKERLFEGFVSLSNKIIDGKRGMGLGLAICKGIIEAHNGYITADESSEGGALFTFALPLNEGEENGQ